MPQTLEDFCAACRTTLKSGAPLAVAIPEMAHGLAGLLANRDFVAATFKPTDEFPKKQLFHCPETDFYVLAHIHQGPKEGAPHSHGASWAIYGTALGVTGMKEWRRTNPEAEDAAVLALADRYDIGPGEARGYGPHTIHSTMHPGKAWVIRVTGTNLDVLPRYRFKKGRDRIEGAA